MISARNAVFDVLHQVALRVDNAKALAFFNMVLNEALDEGGLATASVADDVRVVLQGFFGQVDGYPCVILVSEEYLISALL